MSNEHVEPAFPTSSEMLGHNAGMSLRDYFAAKAMQGYVARGGAGSDDVFDMNISRWSYEMADAMLAERAK